jgi:hypothetical protein
MEAPPHGEKPLKFDEVLKHAEYLDDPDDGLSPEEKAAVVSSAAQKENRDRY